MTIALTFLIINRENEFSVSTGRLQRSVVRTFCGHFKRRLTGVLYCKIVQGNNLRQLVLRFGKQFVRNPANGQVPDF